MKIKLRIRDQEQSIEHKDISVILNGLTLQEIEDLKPKSSNKPMFLIGFNVQDKQIYLSAEHITAILEKTYDEVENKK